MEEVQNVPEDAGASWVVSSDDPTMDGGFIYKAGDSKAGAREDNPEALRSYGSMTYAGLKSMIYADLDKDDYRVKAALDWASKNYDLSENPGLGPQGHYYYLQTLSKALNAYEEDVFVLADGTELNWREDLLLKMLELQQPDGSWYNEKHGRWMESIPELVTSYALITMEVALSE